MHYFEPEVAASLEPLTHPVPSEADLDVYETLNPSQREVFKRVVGNGPVSLLQCPPGTSKTLFATTAKQ
jgi:hypothetical protein